MASDDSSNEGYHRVDLPDTSNEKIRCQPVLDSRCFLHISPDKSLFHDYESIDGGQVLIGNYNAYQIVGMGFVKIRMYNGTTKILEHIRRVP